MRVLRSQFFPIEPQSALRSVRTQSWLLSVTEEQAKELEDKYVVGHDKKGKPFWIRDLKNGKTKKLMSKPNFVRTKRYLDKYFNYKDELAGIAERSGFIMPQDGFFIWFFMPMPKSWTKKKRMEMEFKLHKNKKDTDNLSKAVFDALAPRKSNFTAYSKGTIDDRVISSYANAKIYMPTELDMVGILIVEYDVNDFITKFFMDAIEIMGLEGLRDIDFLCH